MIEASREMVSAAYDEIDFVSHTWESAEAAVKAALAIVERVYDVRCGDVSDLCFGAVRCDAKPGHGGGRHENSTGDSTVFW